MFATVFFGRHPESHVIALAIYLTLLAFVIRVFASYRRSWSVQAKLREPLLGIRSHEEPKSVKPDTTKSEYASLFPKLPPINNTSAQKQKLKSDKLLYHKLQNLELYPDAISEATLRLRTLLDQALSEALSDPSESVLRVGQYSSQALRDYLTEGHEASAAKYERYINRRRQGSPREIFPTREYAVTWLKLAAVVKYVDGGWIGNIHNCGLAAWERQSARTAWQVISEEFGDGDVAKNHVYVYNELMKKLDPFNSALTGDILGFDGLMDDEGSPQCWTAAVAQQCIGLLGGSTSDFLPEALGFNMAYETLPYHLLVTSWELRELKIDDYYFALHVTIDNPDSGHGALGRTAVGQYLEAVRRRDGFDAMNCAWRRVQAGVILADGLPTVPSGPIEHEQVGRHWKPVATLVHPKSPPATNMERDMASLLARKCFAAKSMHCPSKLRFGGFTIEQWLNPASFTPQKGLEFLRILARKRPWVVAGQSQNSRLVRELEWGGRMFGAFSAKETAVVREWIESLENTREDDSYSRFIGGNRQTSSDMSLPFHQLTTRSDNEMSIVLGNFPNSPLGSTFHDLQQLLQSCSHLKLDISPRDQGQAFAALWFTHLGLLEQFPLSPAKFASQLGATVLRILRSIAGFPDLHCRNTICAGMDDTSDIFQLGLWDIGFRFLSSAGLNEISPATLIANLPTNSTTSSFCADMFALRSRPYAHQDILLGLTYGFAKTLYSVQGLIALLSNAERATLSRIQEEILSAIEGYYAENSRDWLQGKVDFWKGYHRATLISL